MSARPRGRTCGCGSEFRRVPRRSGTRLMRCATAGRASATGTGTGQWLRSWTWRRGKEKPASRLRRRLGASGASPAHTWSGYSPLSPSPSVGSVRAWGTVQRRAALCPRTRRGKKLACAPRLEGGSAADDRPAIALSQMAPALPAPGVHFRCSAMGGASAATRTAIRDPALAGNLTRPNEALPATPGSFLFPTAPETHRPPN